EILRGRVGIEIDDGHALLAPGTIDEAVVEDADEPAPRIVSALERLELLARRDAGVLQEIVGIRAVVCEPRCRTVQVVQVRRYERVERFLWCFRHVRHARLLLPIP